MTVSPDGLSPHWHLKSSPSCPRGLRDHSTLAVSSRAFASPGLTCSPSPPLLVLPLEPLHLNFPGELWYGIISWPLVTPSSTGGPPLSHSLAVGPGIHSSQAPFAFGPIPPVPLSEKRARKSCCISWPKKCKLLEALGKEAIYLQPSVNWTVDPIPQVWQGTRLISFLDASHRNALCF